MMDNHGLMMVNHGLMVVLFFRKKCAVQFQTPSESVLGVLFWGLNTFSEDIWSTRDGDEYRGYIIVRNCGGMKVGMNMGSSSKNKGMDISNYR